MTENKATNEVDGHVQPGNRFDFKRFSSISTDVHWSDIVADEVIQKFPHQEVYTCAAGISPSGIVHFGNLRDVMTVYAVVKALERKGKKTRMIFSWDNFDRFRKVPAGAPKELIEYIGQPLTSVPDLIAADGEQKFLSYAERYQQEFEKTLADMGIETEFIYQTNQYTSGRYSELVDVAMRERKTIAKTLFGFMTDIGKSEKNIVEEEYINSYYPLSVYSKFTNTDATEIISYENFVVTYKCLKTNQTDSFDIREARKMEDGKVASASSKLAWKIDWPMRWGVEKVVFEPGGHDHASPGGSYDVSATLARDIFNIEPPVFVGYQFIGLQGLKEKMSGSKGNAITPKQLLEIYEPSLLKWLYMRSNPHQVFNLSFDSEIIRQYEEFDALIKNINNAVSETPATKQDVIAIEMSFQKDDVSYETSITDARAFISGYKPTPFRQIASFGQIVNWDIEKLGFILTQNEISFDTNLLALRMKKAKTWLEIYNTDQYITLLNEQNSEYVKTMDEESFLHVKKLAQYLKDNSSGEIDIEKLEAELYAIPRKEEFDPKQKAQAQRAFFKHVYHLLIGKDTGPRLATFVWAIGSEKAIQLLNI